MIKCILLLILMISVCSAQEKPLGRTMRYQFYREHKYVSFALNDLERLVAKTDFRNQDETQKIITEFHAVVEMLEGHAQYEEEKLHEMLKRKGSTAFEHAEDEHEHYEELLDHLTNLLKELEGAVEEEERIELGYQFYLSYRKFVGENLLHLHGEETIILPELQRLYTDEELQAVEFDTYEKMTPEELVHMLEVLFPHMNPVDKEAFLKDIKESQPEKFKIVWNAIKSNLSNSTI